LLLFISGRLLFDGQGLRVSLLIILQGVKMPTHGSLSKAGKVRSQTPKIAAQERTSPSPKARTRRNYEKRVILQRKAGQNWM